MNDELEQRVRRTLTSTPVPVDAYDMIARVRAGARRRRRHRLAGVALGLALVVGAGAAALRPLLTEDVSVSPVQVPTTTTALTSRPGGVAVTSSGVWVLTPEDQSLLRIDPDTRRTEARLQVAAESMTAVGDRLVLVDGDARNATLLDTRTMRRVPIPGVSTFGNMAFDGDSLWMGSDASGELTQVRLTDGEVLGRVEFPEVENYDSMTFAADGTLWTTTWDGELFHLDLDRRRVLSVTEPFPRNTDYVAVAAVPGAVYAVSGGSDELLKLDPQTAAVTSRRSLGLSSSNGYPAISLRGDELWLVPRPQTVEQLDPRTGEPLAAYRVPVPSGADPALLFNGGFGTGLATAWVGLGSLGSDQHTLVGLTIR